MRVAEAVAMYFGHEPDYIAECEILPGVYLGSANDAVYWDGATICVHEDEGALAQGGHWIPILSRTGEDIHPYDPSAYEASRLALDAATSYIRHFQQLHIPVLVHCWAGIERSPLTMAWFLKRYGYTKTLNEAYDKIREARPIIEDRLHWLPQKSGAGA